ncbi:solute carrier family 8 member 4b isoform X1 [Scophthalmus maximus]|uniref:solute carrier family 8 member 4b isoform X1 n=1 Tax=Scophthalmus maximus TaxID=52904 RepID=UPI001FA82124|nr:solute carrier family 8 member 4b isoform X1 [Scophthalmus maximus]XP_047193493.1 solute carrier family 8 member 4b isoform X1 [Scophthalmus maximus]XP_047193494.1 solute carrier family 8 member 4b isoform X1 [Scophthalmus maximus]XP_047193495.1 solute carrier family 8 member 4b isoform X1 [Scophthalmus maximus]XP_047193496.1 solute carrier family 8 member 4b isoform X1 [Scophthalmus maximus]XP_047193497.1 solute carrier family 8 member 4b isoform X1 [Scophthalmus maximus]
MAPAAMSVPPSPPRLSPLLSLFLSFFLLLSCPGPVQAGSSEKNCSASEIVCQDGVVLPVWNPQNPSVGDKVARAIVYFVALIYMFLGMSIIADRFMSSIEVITSQEKEITIKKPNGETTTTTVRIWNETVSNLTLMALGSSAPEILLSVIEVCGHDFEAGSLGPSTIVGSAAFNMFVIIALCVYVVPDGETRKIKHLRVFFVTAAWSIFAYIWLYLILSVFSPGEVEIWEAVLTFLFFPLCVVQAWVADRRLLVYKFVRKRYRAAKNHGIIIETEGGADEGMDGGVGGGALGPGGFTKMDMLELDGQMALNSHSGMDGGLMEEGGAKDEQNEARKGMARNLKDLKQRHPDKDMEQLIEMANYQVLMQQQKSRAFYRIQATRMMIGAGNILKKHAADQARKVVSSHETHAQEDDPHTIRMDFEPPLYQCFENCGSLKLTVARHGGDSGVTVKVDYRTEDGTANAGSDYEFAEGTLMFKPGENLKEITVGVIDDDIFEEDEYFYVHLSNPRVVGYPEIGTAPLDASATPKAVLGENHTATVTIYDDDHAGIFTFESASQRVSESVGVMEVKVLRTSGARGLVAVPYRTVDGTAKGGEDYELASGKLEFQNDETMKIVKVKIIDDEEYEKNKTFTIELGEPVLLEIGQKHGDSNENKPLVGAEDEEVAKMGCPSLGEHTQVEVVIEESYEFKKAVNTLIRRAEKSTVDKLIKKTNLALVVGSSSWREQFVSAVTVSAGDDDEEESGEERLPSCFDYIMHFLTVFWKVLFAFVPPTEYWNGWACFIVSISLIGVLTAVTGDLASHFGCTIGLKDSVTAVVFVALGTSVPDTFASKVAAIQDQYADASIGNVTGSNAVNVFLGIGVAWTIAAVAWRTRGKPFKVDPGNLAFSVTVFTTMAVFCVFTLLYRRRATVAGGELGGPRTCKLVTSLMFVSLWLIYIMLASLEAYCHIPF